MMGYRLKIMTIRKIIWWMIFSFFRLIRMDQSQLWSWEDIDKNKNDKNKGKYHTIWGVLRKKNYFNFFMKLTEKWGCWDKLKGWIITALCENEWGHYNNNMYSQVCTVEHFFIALLNANTSGQNNATTLKTSFLISFVLYRLPAHS